MTYILTGMEGVMKVSVAEAKAQFSEILRRAEAGEEIEVTRYSKPIVRMTPVRRGLKPGFFGAMKGKIWIAPDFDDPLPEFEASINAPIDPPDYLPDAPADPLAQHSPADPASDPES